MLWTGLHRTAYTESIIVVYLGKKPSLSNTSVGVQ